MVVAFRDGLRSDTKKTLFRRVELRARDLLTNIELIVNTNRHSIHAGPQRSGVSIYLS